MKTEDLEYGDLLLDTRDNSFVTYSGIHDWTNGKHHVAVGEGVYEPGDYASRLFFDHELCSIFQYIARPEDLE